MDLITITPFSVIGITVTTSNSDHKKLSEDMQSLWNRFMSENIIDQIPDKVSNEIYCIYTDYVGNYTKPYVALLGCKVENLDNVPKLLTGKNFTGGKYIKHTVKGNIFEGVVFNAWKNIWNMDDSQRAYTADFEIYGNNAQNPQDAEIEIFVGVL